MLMSATQDQHEHLVVGVCDSMKVSRQVTVKDGPEIHGVPITPVRRKAPKAGRRLTKQLLCTEIVLDPRYELMADAALTPEPLCWR